ncbi:MAG: laminin 2 [Fibrobacteres bacterium]|nr:laminin 2 [Fibrobacterota bacterium]
MRYPVLLVSIASLAASAMAQVEWTPHAGNPVMAVSIDPNALEPYAPSVVVHKGKYHMYYTRKSAASKETLGHAVSDDGVAWSLVDSVCLGLSTTSTRFDSKKLGQASLISEGDTLKMWYWGGGPHGGNIGMAWSLDGKDWTRVDGPATDMSVYDLAMDGNGSPAIACPNVIKDGSGYKMWYSRVKVVGSSISYVIQHASSPDGVAWTKVAGPGAGGAVVETGSADKFDGAMAFFSSVVKDGSTYRMWYCGADTAGDLMTGYATSTDGIAWTKVPGTLPKGALFAGATATVMKSGDGFKMWYMGEVGFNYATSGLPVRIAGRAHPLVSGAVAGGRRFDTRGKRIGTAQRRYPGLSFPRS